MENIKVIRNIKPRYDKNLILSRLGYRKGMTELTLDFKQEFDGLLTNAESLCHMVTAYRYIRVLDRQEGTVKLEDGTILKGKALADLLSDSEEVLLMASTTGEQVTNRIQEMMRNDCTGDAVILDAAASEIADSGLDFVMEYVSTTLRKEGRALTKMRFSPGYGDFNIEQQAHFARLLEIEKLGIALTEAFILLPEKSVLAIAGIIPVSSHE